MKTNKRKPFKISTKELSETLNWDYEDTRSVRNRKAPLKRYEILLKVEQELIDLKNDMKNKIQEKLNH